jgi:large subunit ribosomal protein L9
VATSNALKELEKNQKEILIERELEESLLLKNLEAIKGKTISLKGKANEKGHLFSSIHKKEILEAMMNDHKIEIGESFLVLEKPIKEVGEVEIFIEIKNKKSSFKLIVEKI